MQDMPAWFRRESAVRNGTCNATATPGFFAAECVWSNTNLPAANLNCAAHDMDALAWETKHVNFGEQPLPNSLSEGPAVSHEGLRSDAIVSGSPRACSCPVCLGLHTNLFSSKVPSSALVPRDRYSCRLPACDWMARGLDGATANRYTNALLRHEESHFGQKGRFVCLEERCRYVTKRWGDLTRAL